LRKGRRVGWKKSGSRKAAKTQRRKKLFFMTFLGVFAALREKGFSACRCLDE